jgi:exosortase A
MSQQAAAIPDESLLHIIGTLRGARVGLAVGLAALALLFNTEITAAVTTWIKSTAYNHCFLVIPIVGFLIWDRRSSLRGLVAEPLPLVALLALPLGVAWLVAERLGIMEGRQLVAVSMVEVLFLAMLGWRLWRAVSGPLLYLYFLVPFGEFLTPKLQDITTWFIRNGLDVLGIPAYIDGYIIDIPEGSFFVAQACAGLRFLIASIAFGVLYSLLMYRSPLRRVVFIAVSIIAPIIANGFRALGIVWLGHLLGSADAAATDHILYGWIFFSIVILLLIALGLPFRQDGEPQAPTDPPMTQRPDAARHGLVAGLAVVMLAAIGPIIVLGLDHASAAPVLALKPLDLSPSCINQGAPAMQPSAPGRSIIQRVDCGGTPMTVEMEVFAPRSTAAPVNAQRRRLTLPEKADDISEAPLVAAGGQTLSPWRVIRANEPAFVAVAGVWINGTPTTPGMTMRLDMARSSVLGGADAPVLVTIIPVEEWEKVDMRQKATLEHKIAAIIEAQPGIGGQIEAIAKAAR